MKSTQIMVLVFFILIINPGIAIKSYLNDKNSEVEENNQDLESDGFFHRSHSDVETDSETTPNSNILARKNKPKNPFEPKKAINFATIADKIIEYIIYTALSLGGIYVCFAGFKAFRFTMVIVGFFFAYYGLLFILVANNVYKGDNVGHQLGLFFGSLILGFIISVLCYMLDRINFVIFGTTISCIVCLFLVQFYLKPHNRDEQMIFLIVFLASAGLNTLFAFFVLDHFIIFGCAFVGGVITPINIGIMSTLLSPFENRVINDPLNDIKYVHWFMFICGGMIMAGLSVQYYLRKRLIRKWAEEGEEDNPRGTFLDERF